MRLIPVATALGCLLQSACGVPGLSEPDPAQQALQDPDVLEYVPAAVPAGYGLWNVQPLTDVAGAVIGAETQFAGEQEVIITVCATDDAAMARSECRSDKVPRKYVTRVDRGAGVTVVVECSSERCGTFDPADWLELFGRTAPTHAAVEAEP